MAKATGTTQTMSRKEGARRKLHKHHKLHKHDA